MWALAFRKRLNKIIKKEVTLLWKKVEDSQQMAYFNKLSYGSLWKIIILKS